MGGSSRRRRNTPARRRFSPRPPPRTPSAPLARELTFADSAITNGVGYDLLLKSGWCPGTPLGTSPVSETTPLTSATTPLSRQSSEPLPIIVKRGRAGLGVTHAVLPESELQPRSAPERRRRSQDVWNGNHTVGLNLRPNKVRHVACAHVFDPLRPRCQFDPSHVVRNLKALRKHEMSCPANPARGLSTRAASSPNMDPELTGRVGNLFSSLTLESDDGLEFSDSEIDHSIMSDFSDSETESTHTTDDVDPAFGESS